MNTWSTLRSALKGLTCCQSRTGSRHWGAPWGQASTFSLPDIPERRPCPQQPPGWGGTDTENDLRRPGVGSLRVVPAMPLQLVPVVGRIVAPKDISILIPAPRDCYLIRRKGLCRCRQGLWEGDISLDYTGGPNCHHKCPCDHQNCKRINFVLRHLVCVVTAATDNYAVCEEECGQVCGLSPLSCSRK